MNEFSIRTSGTDSLSLQNMVAVLAYFYILQVKVKFQLLD